jgi:hypothetical protein
MIFDDLLSVLKYQELFVVLNGKYPRARSLSWSEEPPVFSKAALTIPRSDRFAVPMTCFIAPPESSTLSAKRELECPSPKLLKICTIGFEYVTSEMLLLIAPYCRKTAASSA